MSNKELQQGPFSSTTTKTFKITGPIEVTIITKTDSTHVPPAPCGCGGGDSASASIANMIMQAVSAMRHATDASASVDEPGVGDPATDPTAGAL